MRRISHTIRPISQMLNINSNSRQILITLREDSLPIRERHTPINFLTTLINRMTSMRSIIISLRSIHHTATCHNSTLLIRIMIDTSLSRIISIHIGNIANLHLLPPRNNIHRTRSLRNNRRTSLLLRLAFIRLALILRHLFLLFLLLSIRHIHRITLCIRRIICTFAIGRQVDLRSGKAFHLIRW